MKDQISEELLSAYFDGELSANERVQVEHWLNSNPAARQQVADYRRISRMFEGLSRLEVPQEFPTEVLALAERRMLLPNSSSPARRAPIRLWWMAVPAAAAAALLMFFNFSNRAPDPDRMAVANLDGAEQRNDDLPGPGAVGSSSPRGAEDDQVSANPTVRPAVESSVGESVSPVAPVDSRDVAKDKAAAEKPDDGAALVALDSAIDSQVAAVVEDAILGAQKTESGDQAFSAVTVYVDGLDGLALIQRFLEENQIVASSGSNKGPDGAEPDGEASKADAALSPGKQALCVVVTEAEPLVRAFTKMIRERHPAIRISAEDPIVIATLDEDSRARFAKAEREVSQSLERFTERAAKDSVSAAAPAASMRGDGQKSAVAKKAGSKSASGAGIARRGAPSGGPRGKAQLMDRNGAERIAQAAVKAPTGDVDHPEIVGDADEDQMREIVSRQVIVPVPAEVQNRSRSGAPNKLRAPISENSPRPPAQATNDGQTVTAQADADEKASKPAPMLVRMMILIERESLTDDK
ncbi:MAG TPA: hypothetical protein VGM05_19395 [Planctomycetaceae bacterium]|jgi:anti-sigma factor RsiW